MGSDQRSVLRFDEDCICGDGQSVVMKMELVKRRGLLLKRAEGAKVTLVAYNKPGHPRGEYNLEGLGKNLKLTYFKKTQEF